MNNVRSLVLSLLAVAVLALAPQGFAQCPAGCPTSDEIAIQQQLDAVAAAGGGIVQLEARVYLICSPLIVKSNTTLRGAGRGATIIRGTAVANGFITNNAYVGASIAAVGAKNVVISDLTIDHATCNRWANGISFLPKGIDGDDSQAYNGDPVENGSIERVEILGAPQFHSYMIWNLKGRHIKITGNWIDGRATTTSNQEGIESYGGHDVLISGNTVKNIGFGCITLGSAGQRNSELFAIQAVDNHLSGCHIGVVLSTSLAGSDAQNNWHTRIAGNVITGARHSGIEVTVESGTVEGDLIITQNSISDMDANQASGIVLKSANAAIGGDAVVTNTISDNHILNIRGTNASAIRLLSYPNARIVNNSINGVDGSGINGLDSDDVQIIGNRIENSGTAPIVLGASSSEGFSRFIVDDNTLRNWKNLTSGILILTGKRGVVRNNTFTRDDPHTPTPVTAAAKSCSVVTSGNVAWYDLEWPGTFVLPCQ